MHTAKFLAGLPAGFTVLQHTISTTHHCKIRKLANDLLAMCSVMCVNPSHETLCVQRSASSAACLGFCLLKGHESNVDQGKISRLRHFTFTPLETMHGQFKIEVDYAPTAAVNFLEQSTVASQQPQIISDYVRGAQPTHAMHQGSGAVQGGLTASLHGSEPSVMHAALTALARLELLPHHWLQSCVCCALMRGGPWTVFDILLKLGI